jgi:hypothetical protein
MPRANYTIHGAGSHFDGQSMEQWTETWWQWAVQLPTDNNPFQDLNGSAAGAGDVGDVFFLAGIAGSDQDPDPTHAVVARSFDVSAGDTILVPILNWAESVPDFQANNSDPNAGISDVKNFVEGTKAAVVDAFLQIDGKDIFNFGAEASSQGGDFKHPSHRDDFKHPSHGQDFYVQTEVFSLGTVQPGDLGYDQFLIRPAGVEQEPAIAGGYWAAIQHLRPGEHEVHFGGSFDFEGDGTTDFSLDITDTITIESPHGHHTAGTCPDYAFG